MSDAADASADRLLCFRSAARTHPGAVRSHNQDAFLNRPADRLWAVADGMGGHHAGEVASALTIERLAALGRFDSGYAFISGVESALEGANADLVERAAALPSGAVIGATVVVLLIHEGHAACVWAGDSRAYRLSHGTLSRISNDHSVAQAMADAGLPPAAGDPRGHVVTRAVGAEATLGLDRAFAPAMPGDRFLLCSDGLSGALTDPEIASLLGRSDVVAAADALLTAALDRGAQDNVTLVAIEVVDSL